MTPSPIWATPFLDDHHRALAARLAEWSIPHVEEEPADFGPPVRTMLRALADEALLDLIIPAAGSTLAVDVRSVCLIREILAYRSGGLADTAFVMQGIGTAPLWLAGGGALAGEYLDRARQGRTIAAFALTEPDAGSDVAAVATTAVRDGDDYVLNGTKTYITNAGIADHYVIVARTGEAEGARGLSAFLVDADTPGLSAETQDFVAAHAGGILRMNDMRVSASRMVGAPGSAFKLAMQTFDIFRVSVGAAALGFARRALDETVERVGSRAMFGKPMAAIEGVQSKIADMTVALEGAGLQVYRAAWSKDAGLGRCTREVSMAKLVATEAAQEVVDTAVQLFGGAGVLRGSIVERLYREIRPMRIYEGASEVQKLVIARDILKPRS
ncbi:acyl-CoA dehydrogenase [Microvirga sp. SRT01]|uniref:Acyl-CoA dehydrogenase n=1 Tax=Sphingomonas longa TaxID=2778730 RepID=A0ABS2DA63_9SPHN|nr:MULTISPECIES: acyl-CoA dehydrogenase [Alphaproteobacteria]MBM6577820.1 acyl-CoA dehydrogenase [Sphingomonas sp. BT552]MBR7710862.1 acyl-CoA dehydrogenase [Microvirga sp. SRT01]